jgi:predicted DNA-binding protein YlxM (UPF0122 family)
MGFEKDLKWSLYLDVYGEMLTERQSKLFDLYYNEDCSLAEIAEQLCISRQGVLDGIRRAQEKLIGLEKKLGLVSQTLEEHNGV